MNSQTGFPTCELCGRMFMTKGYLKRHVAFCKTQALLKDLKCEYCGRPMSSMYTLQGHLRICKFKQQSQTTSFNTTCSKCGRIYCSSAYMRVHEQICWKGKNRFIQLDPNHGVPPKATDDEDQSSHQASPSSS